MKEIKRKMLPELNDEFARDMSYENLDVMKKGVREELIKEREGFRKSELTNKAWRRFSRTWKSRCRSVSWTRACTGMIEEAQSRYQQQNFPKKKCSR